MALLPAQFPHLQEGRSSHCTWWAAVEGQGEATKPGEVEGQQGATGLAETPEGQRGTPSGSAGPQDASEVIKKYRETKACQTGMPTFTVAAFIIRRNGRRVHQQMSEGAMHSLGRLLLRYTKG